MSWTPGRAPGSAVQCPLTRLALLPTGGFLWPVGCTPFLCVRQNCASGPLSLPHKRSEFTSRVFGTQKTWLSRLKLKAFERYNVAEMLLVMKEAIAGINSFLKITKILKTKKMNFFLE